MIASLTGRVQSVALTSAVLDVHGIGMLVLATPATLAGLRVGTSTTLATSLVVREDSLTLYGFADAEERDMFELVQTANGIGPKVAQAMTAVLGPEDLRIAVAHDDHKAITRVPGIGAKGAQRIVLELKDKLGPPTGTVAPARPDGVPEPAWRAPVLDALLGLGWSAREADRAVEAVEPLAEQQRRTTGDHEVAVLLRAALQSLSKV